MIKLIPGSREMFAELLKSMVNGTLAIIAGTFDGKPATLLTIVLDNDEVAADPDKMTTYNFVPLGVMFTSPADALRCAAEGVDKVSIGHIVDGEFVPEKTGNA
jgi:hypothetical protein